MTASVPLSFIDLCNKSLGFYENERRRKKKTTEKEMKYWLTQFSINQTKLR